MALNLGVKPQKPAVAGPAPSMESIFDAYMGFESVDRATDLFLQKGQQLEDALENLCIIGKAMKMHASAEGMAVVKDIVRNELGQTVSMEAVKETVTNVVAKIKAFFANIGKWIAEYFARFLNIVLRSGKRIDAAIAAVQGLANDATLPAWSYTGIDLTAGPRSVTQTVQAVKNALAGKEGKDLAAAANSAKGGIAASKHEVKDKATTLVVLKAAKDLIAHSKNLQEQINSEYKAAKDSVANAGENDVVMLKQKQKQMKAAVGVIRRYCGVFARTIASVAMHAKVKPGKAAEAPAAK